MATGHLREGAWINAQSGEWSFIDEHSDWAKRPNNLMSIGLPDTAREAVQNIENDFGENRKRILLTVMAAGGVRLRGHGDWLTVEFTIDTASALLACQEVLRRLAGEYTLLRFNNLSKGESLEVYYGDYVQHVEKDLGWILKRAIPSAR
jgi:hypothetical protein